MKILLVPKLPNIGKVVGRRELARYYEEEGRASLARAAGRLAAAAILIGTRGLTATAGALLGSTATKLLHVAQTPVPLVR